MKRKTKQRDAILHSLSEQERPLSIEEILETSAKEIPEINLSTVYRNLKTLSEEGVISDVMLPGETSRWELKPVNHRHYFLCDQCDKVYIVPSCPKGLKDIVPSGFKLRGHSITLNGLCVSCI